MKLKIAFVFLCMGSLCAMDDAARIKKFDLVTRDDADEYIPRSCDDDCNDLDCSICLDVINRAQAEDYTTHCKHVFCCDCLDEWLTHSKNCPLCRAKLTSVNEPGFIRESPHEVVLDQSMQLCIPVWFMAKLLYFKIINGMYTLTGR